MEFDPTESEFTPLRNGVASLTVSEVTKKSIGTGKHMGRPYWAVRFNATDELGNTGTVYDNVMPWAMKGFLEGLGRTDLIQPDASTGKVNVEPYQVLQYTCNANLLNEEVLSKKDGSKKIYAKVKSYISKDGPAFQQPAPTRQEVEDGLPF